jgi:hypothetical protein
MSEDKVQLGMTLPLDSDGFLRRECPMCDREFKWLHGSEEDEDVTPAPDGGYYCPYCGIQAPPESWFTQAQIALAQNTVATEVVGPMLEKFGRDIGRGSRRPVGVSVKYDRPEKIDPLTEVDDMKRIGFSCHPGEPVKVLDDWDKGAYCLVCGTITNP